MSQTTTLAKNRAYVEQLRDKSKGKLFVVLDEAHHGAAPEIARLLTELRAWRCPLLGLTATPVRMKEDSHRKLSKLFDRTIVIEVPQLELIEKGILARPHAHTVLTQFDGEKAFSPADIRILVKTGDLGERVLKELGGDLLRNRFIVDEYLKNRSKYGATIVFAVNIAHAKTLSDEFRSRGIDADYVAHEKPDSDEILARYVRREGPDVLINVEKLTEGFDAPHTKTVFLARPTSSISLFTQMIGRALRGPKSGGNCDAHLVSFRDHWRQYSPITLEAVLPEPGEAVVPPPNIRTDGEPIPLEVVSEVYRVLRNVAPSGSFSFLAAPIGWYQWDSLDPSTGLISRRTVLVFDHQQRQFESLLRDPIITNGGLPAELDEAFGKAMVNAHFSEVREPWPRWLDLVALVDAKRNGLEVEFTSFSERDAFAPEAIAKQCIAQDLGQQSIDRRILEVWSENRACRMLYRDDVRSFRNEVFDAIRDLSSPPLKSVAPEVVALVPKVLVAWPPGESHSLTELRDAVVARPAHFGGRGPVVHSLQWTKSSPPDYFGLAQPAIGHVLLHKDLNSPSVPRFVLEFLLFHELLHLALPERGHDKEFRMRESRFQPSPAALEEAKALGYTPGSTADAWRALGDQFLDQIGTFFRLSSFRDGPY